MPGRPAGRDRFGAPLPLAEGGFKTMSLGKLSIVLIALAAATLLDGAGLLVPPAAGETASEAAAPGPSGEKDRLDRYGDPLPLGAVTRLGTVRFRFSGAGAAFLPDGKTVVSVKGNVIGLWDARTGRLVRAIDTGNLAAGDGRVVLSRDGKRLAVSGSIQDDMKPGWRSAVRVFDLAGGNDLRTFEREPREGVNAVAITPDGKLVFTLDSNGKLRVEEVATGAELLRQQFPGDVMAALALSPDGSMLALASGPNTRKLFLWKWQSAEEPREIEVPDFRGRSLAFSPDGKQLAACSDFKPDVRIVDVASGRLRHKLELPDHEPYRHYSTAFSPDGKLIAAHGRTYDNNGSAVHLWNPSSGEFVKRLDKGGGSLAFYGDRALAFSADGQLLVAGTRVWDLAAGKELSANEEAPWGGVDRVVTGGTDLIVTAGEDNTIRIWDAVTGKHLRRLVHDGWIRGIALSPDRTRLVSSSLDDTVCLWDVATGKKIYRLAGHGRLGGMRAVAFTPDGKAFVAWGDDMYLRKWDMRTGKAVAEYAIRPTGIRVFTEDDDPIERDRGFVLQGVTGGLFSPDARHLVLKAGTKVFLFETKNGKELRSFPMEWGMFVGQAMSPDDRSLLTSASGKPIQTKLPDGTVQSSLPKEHSVTIWELITGERRKQFMLPEQGAGPVAFSADGKLFAAASSRPEHIRVWDASGQESWAAEGFSGVVRSLAFMPDGKRLVSGMDDSSVLIWDLTRKP
jgi:WD40 repeat protein